MSPGDRAKTKKQLIEELEELREKMVQLVSLSELDAIFKGLPDIYLRLDRNGTVLDFKAGSLDDLYSKPEEFVGRKIKNILPPEAGAKLDACIEEVEKTQLLSIFEYALPTPRGKRFYEARIVPFDGHFLTILRNITRRKLTEQEVEKHREHLQTLVSERTAELETTNLKLQEEIKERKKAEQELKIAKEAAEDANRLKSRFLANMSHDIRTPLNTILGFADLTLKAAKDAKSRVYIKKIINSGDALLTLINDILDFSKIEAGQLDIYPRAFMADELTESLTSMFNIPFKEKGLTFNIGIGPRVPDKIYGDKWRILQVLINLISNALKFTEKGEVTVYISYHQDIDCLHFRVTDTGMGIPDKDLKTIFQPFTRLQSPEALEKHGTGIGLAICRDLANLMGGDITVKSQPDIGSDFLFELPAQSQKAQKMPLAERPMEPPDDPGLEHKLDNTILVVDDNLVNQELILEQLKYIGFNSFLQASNGCEAIEKAMTHKPDLILMDIQMPEMDGNETIAALRQQGYQKPIVAVSAFAMREYIERSMEFGADAYITKPIDFNRFYSLVTSFLKEKKHRQPQTAREIPLKTAPENAGDGIKIKPSVSERIRKVFLQEAQKKLTVLDEVLKSEDNGFKEKKDVIGVIAHNFKGNAGFMGLSRLESVAQTLDRAIKENQPVNHLKQHTQTLSNTLTDIIKENYQ
jgi:signal transduction histidine kinase/DNA-binding response OmpR family regulator